MVKGFVFGKFLPFHKGHEAMVQFALTQCDHVSVLICCSEKESVSPEVRKRWVENTFAGQSRIEVLTFSYNESLFPNTSVSSRAVSAIWAPVFKLFFSSHSVLITSEPYGEYVAEFMQIRHIPFDIPKKLYPVSATLIRSDIFAWWDYLPPAVKPDLAIKVVISGTESAGKTTLAAKLSKHFNCTMVPEVGRDIVANSNSFTFMDLKRIAVAHAEGIMNGMQGDNPLIIIDTDINITRSYARCILNTDIDIDENILEANKACLHLYLANDNAHYQDGTRLNENMSRKLDLSHRQVLAENNVHYEELSGSYEEKFKTAAKLITNIVRNYTFTLCHADAQ